jgi:hypothetical protein
VRRGRQEKGEGENKKPTGGERGCGKERDRKASGRSEVDKWEGEIRAKDKRMRMQIRIELRMRKKRMLVGIKRWKVFSSRVRLLRRMQ